MVTRVSIEDKPSGETFCRSAFSAFSDAGATDEGSTAN